MEYKSIHELSDNLEEMWIDLHGSFIRTDQFEECCSDSGSRNSHSEFREIESSVPVSRNSCNEFRETVPKIRPLTLGEKTLHLEVVDSGHSGHFDSSCAICLSSVCKTEKIYKLNCRHLFHKECIDNWFEVSDELECPMCRELNSYSEPVNRVFYKNEKSPRI